MIIFGVVIKSQLAFVEFQSTVRLIYFIDTDDVRYTSGVCQMLYFYISGYFWQRSQP